MKSKRSRVARRRCRPASHACRAQSVMRREADALQCDCAWSVALRRVDSARAIQAASPRGWRRYDAMNVKPGHRRIGPFDIGDSCCRLVIERALVADLAAGFGIERCQIQHDFGLYVRRNSSTELAILQQRDDIAVVLPSVIAEKLRRAAKRVVPDKRARLTPFGALPTGASALSLPLHLAIEAVAVDCRPNSRAISSCSSMASPKVSYSLNAAAPASTPALRDFASS